MNSFNCLSLLHYLEQHHIQLPLFSYPHLIGCYHSWGNCKIPFVKAWAITNCFNFSVNTMYFHPSPYTHVLPKPHSIAPIASSLWRAISSSIILKGEETSVPIYLLNAEKLPLFLASSSRSSSAWLWVQAHQWLTSRLSYSRSFFSFYK